MMSSMDVLINAPDAIFRSRTCTPSSLHAAILPHWQFRHRLLRRLRSVSRSRRSGFCDRRIQPRSLLELPKSAAGRIVCSHCVASHSSSNGVGVQGDYSSGKERAPENDGGYGDHSISDRVGVCSCHSWRDTS